MAARDSVGTFAKFVPPAVVNGKVYNSTGAIVFQKQVVLGSDLRIYVQRTPAMPEGVYFIRLTPNSGKTLTARVIWNN